MSSTKRVLAAWAVMVSLLGGLLLPLQAAPVMADADGACGATLILAHSIQHFEAPLPSPEGGHCVLCHFWNAIATASIAGGPHAQRSPNALPAVRRPGASLADLFVPENAAPRGPPARS